MNIPRKFYDITFRYEVFGPHDEHTLAAFMDAAIYQQPVMTHAILTSTGAYGNEVTDRHIRVDDIPQVMPEDRGFHDLGGPDFRAEVYALAFGEGAIEQGYTDKEVLERLGRNRNHPLSGGKL